MNKKGKKKTERNKGVVQAIVEVWELNGFVASLHLFVYDFVRLMYKASLIFKLKLSIILKERELYETKHFVVECRCLKICDL